MARPPLNQIGPTIPFPERDDQTYDYVQAQNTPRQGARYFEEQLFRDPSISASLVGGAASDLEDHNVYEYKVATGRGRLGSGNPGPAWDAVAPEMLAQFASAADFGDAGDPYPPAFARRAGANPSTVSPTVGLNRGERQGQVIITKVAENPRRRNQADVSHL
jgi:hypothetical protein